MKESFTEVASEPALETKALILQAGKGGREKAQTESRRWKPTRGVLDTEKSFLPQRNCYILRDNLLSFRAEMASCRVAGSPTTFVCRHTVTALPGSLQTLGHFVMERGPGCPPRPAAPC